MNDSKRATLDVDPRVKDRVKAVHRKNKSSVPLVAITDALLMHALPAFESGQYSVTPQVIRAEPDES